MADFDLEQLKTLFENLGDRLEKTKGDQLSRDELYRIRTVLNKMSAQAGKATPGGNGADTKTIISQAVKELKKAQPAGGSVSSPTPRRNTIIREEKARRQGDTGGNTILDQILRKSAKEANDFGNTVTEAGTKTKTFGDRVSSASGAFAAVSTAASVFTSKMLGVGAERVDFYRELMASGEGTVSSMQDMGRQAAAAGMTVQQFVEAMSKGTQGARQMGAIKFGDVRKSVLEMSKASGYMGMLPDQITQVTSTYAEILRLQGSGKDRSSAEIAGGIMNLAKTSETTAHILGLSREDALKAQAELAKNAQLNAVMQAKGIDPETARSLVEQVTQVAGQSGRDRLLDQMTFGQAGPDSAQFQAVNSPMADAIANIGDKINAGQKGQDILVDAARSMQTVGRQQQANKSQTLAYAQFSRLNAGGMGQVFTDTLQGAQLSQGLNTDKNFNRATNQNQNEEQRAGQGALQVAQTFQNLKVAGDAAITAVFNPMVNVYGPKLRDQVLPAMDSFAKRLTDGAMEAETHTTAMASLGTIALAIAGGLTLFTGALSIATKSLGLLNSLKTGVGALFGGGGAAAGATEGAAAGAAGIGAGAAALAAGGVLAGGVGMYAGGSMIANRNKSGESFLGQGKDEQGFWGSRASGYGTSAASGALAGAALGSIIPGLGTLVGAGVGGAVGLGSAAITDFMSSGDASQAPQKARAGSQAPRAMQRPTPANATGQKGKATLSADQMTTKIMEASDRSANLLKMIKENSDKHLDATREEVAVLRAMSDRLGRLLEDGNKNTKSIADHSV